MNKKNKYLLRILSTEFDYEIYEIQDRKLHLLESSQKWQELKKYSLNTLIISLSLDLVAIGQRKTLNKKILDSGFYFEKNIISSKSDIYFHPAIIKKQSLFQVWVKRQFWTSLQSNIDFLNVNKVIITIDSCVVAASDTLPQILFNKCYNTTFKIQHSLDFIRTISDKPLIKDFSQLTLQNNFLKNLEINFAQKNKKSFFSNSYLLVLLLVFNLILLTSPLWVSNSFFSNLFFKEKEMITNKQNILNNLLQQPYPLLILQLENILSVIIEQYNSYLHSLFIDDQILTLVFTDIPIEDVNKITSRLEEKFGRVVQIQNQENKTIVEVELTQ